MKKLFLLPVLFYFFSCSKPKSSSEWTISQRMEKALQWQEENPIVNKSPKDWTSGAYYTGVMRGHMATGNAVFLDALKNIATSNAYDTYERPYHADDVAISYTYLYLKRMGVPEVNLEPTAKFMQEHLIESNQWNSGKGNAFQPILWWWCDALFMAPPVIAAYVKETKDPELLNSMHKYYMETYDLLFDQEEKLFARDTRYQWTGSAEDKKEPNGKKIFWSRGNGWVLAGLALLLDELPKDYEHRAFYENLYKTMAARILELQPEDGLWRTSLLNPESFTHGEVSGSGFYTFALAWGVNNGMLDRDTYGPAVKKAWNALAVCQQATGKVGWVQNIGADPQPANADSFQNFGTGAFIMAGSEILKMK